MNERCPNQGWNLVRRQFLMPARQRLHQRFDVVAVLRRLIATAVRRVTHMSLDRLGVIAENAGLIVRMGQSLRDRRMHFLNERHLQPPTRCRRGLLRHVVGRLEIHRPELFFFPHLGRVQIQDLLGFLLGQSPALDGVRAKNAAGHDLAFQLAGDLRQRRDIKPLVSIQNPLVQRCQRGPVHAQAKRERSRAAGFDLRFRLGKRIQEVFDVRQNVHLKNEISSLSIIGYLDHGRHIVQENVRVDRWRKVENFWRVFVSYSHADTD